jgi:F-type H+-transporting ATPase subunit delta
MRNRKKQAKVAKSMFRNSLTAGYIDPKKVNSVLGQVTSSKTADLISILKIYKKLVASALMKEEIIVEIASDVTQHNLLTRDLLKKTGAKKVTFRKNNQMVFGSKVTHGDWIWEETLDSKLKQIANT